MTTVKINLFSFAGRIMQGKNVAPIYIITRLGVNSEIKKFSLVTCYTNNLTVGQKVIIK